MKRLLSYLVFASAFSLAATAQADTISDFYFTTTATLDHKVVGNPPPPINVTGFLRIDTTTGVPVDSYIEVPHGNFSTSIVSTQLYNSDETGVFFTFYPNATTTSFEYLDLYLPVSTLVGYAGGVVCSTSIICNGDESVYGFGSQTSYVFAPTELVLTGSRTITSVTPEPSSLVLLGTGLLGALGATRHRFTK